MSKWRDLAARLEGHDNSDVSDNSPPNVPIVTNVTALPPSIAAGLRKLEAMPVPRGTDAKAWRGAVVDALALERNGWAATAIALGWSALDLFGAAKFHPSDDGLAVWLEGRRLVALSDSFALVEADGVRHYFNRGGAGESRLLWELGQ